MAGEKAGYWLKSGGREVGQRAARVGRWVVRRPRNVAIAGAVLTVALLVWLMGLSISAGVSLRQAEQRAAAAEAAAPGPVLEVAATPVAGGREDDGDAATDDATPGDAQSDGPSTSSTPTLGNGPQAPTSGATLPAASAASIPAPSKPTADTAKPDSVTRAWATAYYSRPSRSWTQWREWVAPWVDAKLVEHMAGDEFNPRGALDGTQATTVTGVRLKPSDGSAGRDTPVRWSRTVEIDVKRADGHTTTVTYIIEADLTGSGWQIVAAEKRFWTVR